MRIDWREYKEQSKRVGNQRESKERERAERVQKKMESEDKESRKNS